MKRGEFITAAGALSAMPFLGFANTQQKSTEPNQFIEFIKYQLHPGARQKLVGDFYRDVAIPALNRLGIKTIGAFTGVYGPDNLSLYILIPHASLEAVYTDNEKLLNDKDYLAVGDKYLNAPIIEPAFAGMEKTILRAFNNLASVQVPENLMSSKTRIYELRVYQSSNPILAKKKIHMFNEGGEIEIFRKTGMQPVFFGETIAGRLMPNLHYMLAFENMEARDKNWDQFRNHPDWTKLKSDPYYADTVSCITDYILKPTPFSQI